MLLKLPIPGNPVLLGDTSAQIVGTPNPTMWNPAVVVAVRTASVMVESMMMLSSAGGWPQ
jgi:hypothetical protein